MALAVMGLTDVFAHGVQVGYCQLSNGYIRIFVEHWHGNLSTPGQAGTMSITTTYGSTSVTQNLTPTGVINNTSYNNLSGCGSSISIISSCSGQANTYNDWVSYQAEEEQLKLAEWVSELSGEMEQACHKYRIPYFEMNEGFEGKIQAAFDYLIG